MSDAPDAYAEGYDAYLSGRGEWTNPYSLEDAAGEHALWLDGWNAAAEEAAG